MTELNAAPKLCECGCGEPTQIAPRTRTQAGWVKGEPLRFRHGHATRLRSTSAETRVKTAVPLLEPTHDLMPIPLRTAWIYVFWNAAREPLYVGQAVRLHALARIDDHSYKSPWWDEVAFYSVQAVDLTDVDACEYRTIRQLHPKYNRAGNATCGTHTGYKAHLARKEPVCEPCREAENAYARDRRRKKGIDPPKQSQCGTYGGYFSHLSRREPPCDACRKANTERARRNAQRRAGAQGAVRPVG